MNRYFTTLFWTLLLLLCPAITRAERIGTDHNFQTLVEQGKYSATNLNTTIRTDFVTYQCSGTDAKMQKDSQTNRYWCFHLPKTKNAFVTTTRINELAEFNIVHYPNANCKDFIKIYVTTDSLSWGDPLTTDNVTYSIGTINVAIPRNNYYVRIKSTSSSDNVSILEIDWYQDHCNCFIYNPE